MAEKKAFLLRISPELWADLNRWAGDELRSVNGQIEYVLRRAVEERKHGRAEASRVRARKGLPPETHEEP